jgi:hypothetical protein
MDPWLERRWSGFHLLLISHVQNQINRQVRALGLVARVDERVYIESLEGIGRSLKPDVYVVRSPVAPRTRSTDSVGMTALAEPFEIELTSEPETVGFIEILDAADQTKVITAIEILSPTNKIDPRARKEYRQKRKEYHQAQVSTVEIDLLRDGDSLAEISIAQLRPAHRTPYMVWIRRGWQTARPSIGYIPIPLRAPLPQFIVPLRQTDPEVRLDLQVAFDAAYEQGSYDLMDYDRDPEPALSEEDMDWAREQIKQWREKNIASGPDAPRDV